MRLLFGLTAPAKTSVGFAICISSMETNLPGFISDFMNKKLDLLIGASKALLEDPAYTSRRHELRLVSLVKSPVKITIQRREYRGVIQRVWWDSPKPNSYEVTLADGCVVEMSAADVRGGEYIQDDQLHNPLVALGWAEFEKMVGKSKRKLN